MHRLALTAALLMPVVIDGALIAEVTKAMPVVHVAEGRSTEKEELGVEDIERLTEEVEKAEEASNYQKAIDTLEQILAIGHLEKRRYLHLHPLIKKHLTVPKGKYLHINRVIKEAQVVFDQ